MVNNPVNNSGNNFTPLVSIVIKSVAEYVFFVCYPDRTAVVTRIQPMGSDYHIVLVRGLKLVDTAKIRYGPRPYTYSP